MSVLSHRLGLRVVQSMGVRGASAFFAFLLSFILLREAGAERFAAFSVAVITVQLLAPLSLFGMESLLLRLSIRSLRLGDGALQRVFRREAYGLGLIISLATSALMAGGGLLLALADAELALVGRALLLMSPAVLFTSMGRLSSNVVRISGRDGLSQLLDGAVPSIATTLALLVGIAAGRDWSGAVEILYTATAGLAALYGLKFAPIPERSLRNGLTLMKSRRMRFLRAAMPIQIANMANYLSDWAIVWLLMLTASLPDVAAYRVISQIGTLFMLLSIGIEVPYSTAIAGAHASGTQDLVRRLFRQSRILLLLMGLPLIVALIIFPGELLALFEVRSASAHYALLLVTAGHAFRLSTGASASSLVVLNGHRALVRSSLLALAISAVLALCLAPWFGLIGAALASGLGMTARSWLNLLATKRIIASPFR